LHLEAACFHLEAALFHLEAALFHLEAGFTHLESTSLRQHRGTRWEFASFTSGAMILAPNLKTLSVVLLISASASAMLWFTWLSFAIVDPGPARPSPEPKIRAFGSAEAGLAGLRAAGRRRCTVRETGDDKMTAEIDDGGSWLWRVRNWHPPSPPESESESTVPVTEPVDKAGNALSGLSGDRVKRRDHWFDVMHCAIEMGRRWHWMHKGDNQTNRSYWTLPKFRKTLVCPNLCLLMVYPQQKKQIANAKYYRKIKNEKEKYNECKRIGKKIGKSHYQYVLKNSLDFLHKKTIDDFKTVFHFYNIARYVLEKLKEFLSGFKLNIGLSLYNPITNYLENLSKQKPF
jgi:hypothetical protein